MDRRQFARSLAGAAAGALAVRTPISSAADIDLPVSFKLSVMLWTIYRDSRFEERLERVSEAGYGSVELVDEFKQWSEQDFRKFRAQKHSLGLTVDACTLPVKGIVDPAKKDEFLSDLKKFLPTAEKLECPALIILSGNRIEGVAHEVTHQACVDTLKYGADLAAQANVTLLVENIDPEENPKYFLTSVAEGFEIIRQVDHPRVKFLYDFYHEQISEGNLIEKLEKNIDLVGLVHIADVPGRHQPGTGEINFASIFRKLDELKYNRYAAMEFIPTGDPVQALRGARELAARSVHEKKEP
jgi:hydroxypyruvate isomerase